MTFERIYELAIEAAGARVNAVLKMLHEQAIAELNDLGQGYNQMIIDKNKEMGRNGNA